MSGGCPTRGATAAHTATLIFLHGLGDTGHGWLGMLSDICGGHVKVMCPNAPIAKVTLNFGMQMPSWFDIASLQFDAKEDEKGIVASSDRLKAMIEEEVKAGIPYEKIMVGGFSQGGAVALHTFITHTHQLGGCIGLSTFLTLHTKFDELKQEANKGTAVFLGHGTDDPVVNFNYGKLTRAKLSEHYSAITWKEYKGLGHSSDPTEMSHVKKFIAEKLTK